MVNLPCDCCFLASKIDDLIQGHERVFGTDQNSPKRPKQMKNLLPEIKIGNAFL